MAARGLRRPACRAPALVLLACLAAPGEPPVHARASGPPGFDPARAAAPYFSDGAGREALALLGRRDHAGCVRALAPLVAPSKRATPETRFLFAYCQLKAGQTGAAAAAFDALVDDLPLLADHARLYGAEARLVEGDLEGGLARARRVAADSALRAEADLTAATALDRAGRRGEAADAYAAYVRAYPSSWRVAEVRGRLAEALDAAGRTAEATDVWREVWIESPISLGPRAEARLDPSLPPRADELARRAMVLFDGMRNKESEAAWNAVLGASDVTPALACRARYHVAQSVWKQRDRQRAAPLFEAASVACKAAKDGDLSAKSLYQAGRAHGSRAEKDAEAGARALALYLQLMSEHPAHSYADDAALRRAAVLDVLKRPDEATTALTEIPDRFPTGDQRGEALFQLAFRAFERGDFAGARPFLDKELQLLPREEGWWEAGRTLYWLGRVHDALGAGDEAKRFYTRALREYPLSFYALLAANRLRERAPAEVEALLQGFVENRPAGALAVADRPLFHTPAFHRALLLLRLGLGAEARRELHAAGLEVPRKGRPAPAGTPRPPGAVEGSALPADRELGWIASRLFEAAGDWAASHAYGRYVDTEYARSWPQGDNEARWRLSFPRAYAGLVEENVARTGQPAALELAIMREESAFDPNLESFANAVGLTQLTAAPAARWAQGLPHDPRALRDPAINIAIGARELGALYALFEGNAALAIAAYNAGEGAVKRWLRDPEHKDRALDEFIERIPFDETRGYTKRVLGSYFTYAWLAGGPALTRVPRVGFALPRKK